MPSITPDRRGTGDGKPAAGSLLIAAEHTAAHHITVRDDSHGIDAEGRAAAVRRAGD